MTLCSVDVCDGQDLKMTRMHGVGITAVGVGNHNQWSYAAPARGLDGPFFIQVCLRGVYIP